ncbi:hypothetical protein AMAG_07989 [Allomyces macrogynus ATCC 38327]|uniref:Uncharacterized protein n=1 Tax=Allomyces macrogynus (strain ATCC 38327) TaxID=578462 RepID=A0A0L0SK06_ALLM3|nr:hypothetical protein AMAG_07989 [Allomyces macrogynus ATCC 38327]|eukprot:KNE62808.1 hypothetical protein AMAG_07989 [Allomyces macrogynus ATCC 38327]
MGTPEANGLILAPSRAQHAPAPTSATANDTSHTILLALHVPLHAAPAAGPPPTVRICEPVLLSTPNDAARAHHVLGAVSLDSEQMPCNVSPTVHQLLPTMRALPGAFHTIVRATGNTPVSVPAKDEWFMKLKEGQANQVNGSSRLLTNAPFLQLPPTTLLPTTAPPGTALGAGLMPALQVPTADSALMLPSFLANPPFQEISLPQRACTDAKSGNDVKSGTASNDQATKTSDDQAVKTINVPSNDEDDDEVAQILSQVNAASQAPAELATKASASATLPAAVPTSTLPATVPTSAAAATVSTSNISAALPTSSLPGTLPTSTLPAALPTLSFSAPHIPHATSAPFSLPTAAPPAFAWSMPPPAAAPMAGHMSPPGAPLPSLLPPAAPPLAGFMPPPAAAASLLNFSAALGLPMPNPVLQNQLSALGMLPSMLPPAAGATAATAQIPAPASVGAKVAPAAATAESHPDATARDCGSRSWQDRSPSSRRDRDRSKSPRRDRDRDRTKSSRHRSKSLRRSPSRRDKDRRDRSRSRSRSGSQSRSRSRSRTRRKSSRSGSRSRSRSHTRRSTKRARSRSRSPSRTKRARSRSRSASRHRHRSDMPLYPADEVPFVAYYMPRMNTLARSWPNRIRHALQPIGAMASMQLVENQGKITFTMPRRPGIIERLMQKSGLVLAGVRLEFEPILSADKPHPPLHLPTLPVFILLNLPPVGVIDDLLSFLTYNCPADQIYLDLVGAVRPHKQWSFAFATVLPGGDPKAVEAMHGREIGGRKLMVKRIDDPKRFFATIDSLVDLLASVGRVPQV